MKLESEIENRNNYQQLSCTLERENNYHMLINQIRKRKCEIRK